MVIFHFGPPWKKTLQWSCFIIKILFLLLQISLSLSLLLLVCNLGLRRRQSQCAWQLPAIFTPSRTLLPPTTSFLDNAALFQFLFHCMMWNNVAHSPLTLSFLDNALQRWTTFSILIWMCTMHNKIFPCVLMLHCFLLSFTINLKMYSAFQWKV